MIEVTASIVQILKSKKKDLERQIGDREEIQVEKLADPLDISTAQASRDSAAGNINRAVFLLREVTGALGRVQDGTYGICVECEEDIPEKRLGALPWAARCIPCQEAWDADLKIHTEPERMAERRVTLGEIIANREAGRGRRV